MLGRNCWSSSITTVLGRLVPCTRRIAASLAESITNSTGTPAATSTDSTITTG